jgi:hypothetical protein
LQKKEENMEKIRRYVIILVSSGAIAFAAACGSSGGGSSSSACTASGTCNVNITGTWSTTENVSANACGNAHTDYNTYTITQTGCNAVVVPNTGSSAGVTFNGVVNGNQICWTGSYPANGGTETINSLILTVNSSGTSFNGTASWTWSDGSNSCSGTTQVSGTKS